MASDYPPVKGTSGYLEGAIWDTSGNIIVNPSGLTCWVAGDGASGAASTNTPVCYSPTKGFVRVLLNSSERNFDTIRALFGSTSANVGQQNHIVINTVANSLDSHATESNVNSKYASLSGQVAALPAPDNARITEISDNFLNLFVKDAAGDPVFDSVDGTTPLRMRDLLFADVNTSNMTSNSRYGLAHAIARDYVRVGQMYGDMFSLHAATTGQIAALPTSGAIADAVWDEIITTGHSTDNSAARKLKLAMDYAWDAKTSAASGVADLDNSTDGLGALKAAILANAAAVAVGTPHPHYPTSGIVTRGTVQSGAYTDLESADGAGMVIRNVALGTDVEFPLSAAEENHTPSVLRLIGWSQVAGLECQMWDYNTSAWVKKMTLSGKTAEYIFEAGVGIENIHPTTKVARVRIYSASTVVSPAKDTFINSIMMEVIESTSTDSATIADIHAMVYDIDAEVDTLVTSVGDVPTAAENADAVWLPPLSVGWALVDDDSPAQRLDLAYYAATQNRIAITDPVFGLNAAHTHAEALSGQVAALPTSGAIADAVWEEDLNGHQTEGTAGYVSAFIAEYVAVVELVVAKLLKFRVNKRAVTPTTDVVYDDDDTTPILSQARTRSSREKSSV